MKGEQFNAPENEIEITLSKNMRDIEQFAEFFVSWLSAASEEDNLTAKRPIHFTLKLPTLTLVDVPLKVRITNENDLNKLTVYQAVPLNFEVTNQSDNVIECELSIEECEDFYIGGELKTYLPLMPQEQYIFTYNVIPLQIGRLSMPKFSIIELVDSNERGALVKGLTKKCLVLK